MTEYLKKEDVLYLRDTEGKLLPQDVKLETIEGDNVVKVLPMTKGELNTLYSQLKDGDTSAEQDVDIVEKFLIEPKLTRDEIVKAMKPQMIAAITIAILSLTTGKDQKELSNESKAKIAENSDFLQ